MAMLSWPKARAAGTTEFIWDTVAAIWVSNPARDILFTSMGMNAITRDNAKSACSIKFPDALRASLCFV
jgi:hypothetical protein